MRADCIYPGCGWVGPEWSGKTGGAQAADDLDKHMAETGHTGEAIDEALAALEMSRRAFDFKPGRHKPKFVALVSNVGILYGLTDSGAVFQLCAGQKCPFTLTGLFNAACGTGRVWHEIGRFSYNEENEPREDPDDGAIR